jgi:DNA-binding NarL/FixJ family response regulator
VVAPSVLIAANPYEGELCRKALAETGLQVELCDSIEGAMAELARAQPLAVVIADGWSDAPARELLVEVRAAYDKLPIFLLEDRDSDIADEDAAIRRGATRLFLRPINLQALADAIEKLAVEAELASEVSAGLDSARNGSPAPAVTEAPALPHVDRAIELVASSPDEWDPPSRSLLIKLESLAPQKPATPEPPVALFAPEPAPVPPPAPVVAPPTPPESIDAAPALIPRVTTEVIPPPTAPSPLGPPPPSTVLPRPEPLLRADEALADAAGLRIQSLATNPDFVMNVSESRGHEAAPPTPAPGPPGPEDSQRWQFADRSTFARRLDLELSEAERRLFPDSPGTPPRPRGQYDDYDDALGDIDLDALGIDTLPGIAADSPLLDGTFERKHPAPVPQPAVDRIADTDGNSDVITSPLLRLATGAPAGDRPIIEQAVARPIDEEGSLADHDVAELLANLHASGFSGRVVLQRGDGEKHLYLDAGVPVFATSSFPHDRLGDLLYREGKLTREQHARTRELTVEPGRRTAATLVELGLLKPKELFPALRRHVEEILYSCFAWDTGSYRLGPEQAPGEDRLRLSVHPWALLLEGIRRKYGLERLIELVGPPETVLTPTTNLQRALADCGLTSAERVVCELFDGERSLTDLELAIAGLPGASLGEGALYALTWALVVIGAVRSEDHSSDRLGVRAASTVVTSVASLDRRRSPRDDGGRPEVDRAIDRERVLTKLAQIGDADYFGVLGVDAEATPHEIERAFERLRVDFEPERFAPEVREELTDALSEIRLVLDEARRVLLDEDVRRSYRANLGDRQ